MLRISTQDRDVHLRGGNRALYGVVTRSIVSEAELVATPWRAVRWGTPGQSLYRRRGLRRHSPKRWLGRYPTNRGDYTPVPKGFGPESSQQYLQATTSQRHLGPVTPRAKALPCRHRADRDGAAATAAGAVVVVVVAEIAEIAEVAAVADVAAAADAHP